MRNLAPYRPVRVNILDCFDSCFGSFPVDRSAPNGSPAVDIREEDDVYLVQAELPGVSEQDLKVSVDDNVLTISTKSDRDSKGNPRGYLVQERRGGQYKRSFALPRDTDSDEVSAVFGDGLLTITVGKTEGSKSRQIPVKVA